jgi:coenzyme F420-0:L-glutamate ligase / coenzyme F420-1:gamma-L-glutamate ligase
MNTGVARPFAGIMLRDARVARLATADAQGTPHVIPVCFAFGRGVIYSAIDAKPKRTSPRGLRRVQNIMANPRVALVVDYYDEDWGRLRYVLVRGTAAIVDRGRDHHRAIARLRAKYRQYRTMRLEDRPVLKISRLTIVAWEARGGRGGRVVASPRRRPTPAARTRPPRDAQ